MLTVFRADGLLDYIQDTNGNRITAGYTGAQLTTVTNSNGGALTLSYNTQGRISAVTDSTGRVTTYAYDTRGRATPVSRPSRVRPSIPIPRTRPARPPTPLPRSPAPRRATRLFHLRHPGPLDPARRGRRRRQANIRLRLRRLSRDRRAGQSSTFYFDDSGSVTRTLDTLGVTEFMNHDAENHLVSAAVAGGGRDDRRLRCGGQSDQHDRSAGRARALHV